MEKLLAELTVMLEEAEAKITEIDEQYPNDEYDPSSW